MSKKTREIIGKRIPEYKLPLIERVAYWHSFFVWLVWLGIASAIITPTIYANYENLWYYLLIAPIVVLLVISTCKFVKLIYLRYKCKAKIEETIENEHHYDNYSGPPGSGKTLTAMFLYHEKAKYNWSELQFEYFLIVKRLKKVGYDKLSLDEKEIVDAYRFYIENDGAPCFSANIPAYSKLYKRFAYDVGVAYLKQEARAPYRLCSVYDEIGTVATTELYYGRASNNGGATDMTDTAKFCRHFNLWNIVGCEQDYNNIYIDFKRVASENRVYSKKKWLLKPRFLLWLYEKLKNHFLKHMWYSEAVLFSSFMKKFKNYIYKCGFFKFTYIVKANTETKSGNGVSITVQTAEEKDVVYIPRANEIVYRTRAFREAYKAKDKPIEMKPYTSLYMSDSRARSMLKSENLIKKDPKANKSK